MLFRHSKGTSFGPSNIKMHPGFEAVCVPSTTNQPTNQAHWTEEWYIQRESKKSPLRFSEMFPKRLGIFNHFFTHLLYDHFYTIWQTFIHIFPTSTKLCHTKHDHL